MPTAEEVEALTLAFGGGGPGKERMLPRAGFQHPDPVMQQMMETWGAKDGDAEGGKGGEPGLVSALVHVGGANLLARPFFRGPSIADRLTNEVFERVNKISPADLAMPTKEEIDAEVAGLTAEYARVTPYPGTDPSLVGLGLLDDKIDAHAQDIARQARRGALDTEYDPTDDEQTLAHALWLQAGVLPPDELTRMLYSQVFTTAADLAAQQEGSMLGAMRGPVAENMKRLASIRDPKRWFIIDPVSAWVLLTRSERKLLSGTTWGLTPTEIVIRDLKAGEVADELRLPLSALHKGSSEKATGGNSILVQSGTADYVDILRRKGTLLFRNWIEAVTEEAVGGTVHFRSLGADKPLAKIAVRHSPSTIENFSRIGKVIRNSSDMLTFMTQKTREQDPKPKLIIRPNIVKQLVPDGSIFDLPIVGGVAGRRVRDEYSLILQLREAQKNARFRLYEDAMRGKRINTRARGLQVLINGGDRAKYTHTEKTIRMMEGRLKLLKEMDKSLPEVTSYVDAGQKI